MGIKRKMTTGRILRTAEGTIQRCECCGSCECAGGEDCENLPLEEFHIRWDGLAIEEIFRRETSCCCDNATIYRIYSQRMGSFASSGDYCHQTDEGEGVSPYTSHFTYIRNGATILEYDYTIPYAHCDPAGPNVGYEGCRNNFTVGTGTGEWHRTCSEDWGWWSEVRFGGLFTQWHTWYSAMIPDPEEECISGCGACCLPDEAGCIMTSHDGCTALGGSWYSGEHCFDPEVPCHPDETGACCENYECSQTTEEECEGIWLGRGSSCDPDPCGETPTGACCIEGECFDGFTFEGCTAASGTYQGNATACATIECPEPDEGACCFPNGFCDQETSGDCATNGGVWSAGQACSQTTCPTGACCKPDGTCVVTGSLGCTALSGTYLGDGTDCDGEACIGCCCVDGAPFGNVTKAECDAESGTWYGPNTECAIPGEADSPPPGIINCGLVGGDSGGFL